MRLVVLMSSLLLLGGCATKVYRLGPMSGGTGYMAQGAGPDATLLERSALAEQARIDRLAGPDMNQIFIDPDLALQLQIERQLVEPPELDLPTTGPGLRLPDLRDRDWR